MKKAPFIGVVIFLLIMIIIVILFILKIKKNSELVKSLANSSNITQNVTNNTPVSSTVNSTNPSTQTNSGTTNSQNTTNTTPSFTLAQVAQHATASDCWMAIEGDVYNVTSFVSFHPGGQQIVLGCGKDATTLFETQGGEGSHSSNARAMLFDLKIGSLAQ